VQPLVKIKKDFDNIKLRGTTMKIIDAQQAKLCTNYKNTKLELLKQKLQYGLIKCAELNI
jgi:hypothetical protein